MSVFKKKTTGIKLKITGVPRYSALLYPPVVRLGFGLDTNVLQKDQGCILAIKGRNSAKIQAKEYD